MTAWIWAGVILLAIAVLVLVAAVDITRAAKRDAALRRAGMSPGQLRRISQHNPTGRNEWPL